LQLHNRKISSARGYFVVFAEIERFYLSLSPFPTTLNIYKWNVTFTSFSSRRKFKSLVPNSAVSSSVLNDPGFIRTSIFLNKPMKSHPKEYLGQFQSGVRDLPYYDPSIVTSTIYGKRLYINVILL
jgi:hypothetical protein